MTEPSLTELEKLRRTIIVIQHTALNIGYFRGARAITHKAVAENFLDIQRRIDNNFLDMAIIEFCKLFAQRESQHWSRMFSPGLLQEFENGLCKVVGRDEACWKTYIGEFLTYRDKFLAHLDQNREMNIPDLGLAIKALHYYAQFLRAHHPLANALDSHQYDIETFVSDASKNAQAYLP